MEHLSAKQCAFVTQGIVLWLFWKLDAVLFKILLPVSFFFFTFNSELSILVKHYLSATIYFFLLWGDVAFVKRCISSVHGFCSAIARLVVNRRVGGSIPPRDTSILVKSLRLEGTRLLVRDFVIQVPDGDRPSTRNAQRTCRGHLAQSDTSALEIVSNGKQISAISRNTEWKSMHTTCTEMDDSATGGCEWRGRNLDFFFSVMTCSYWQIKKNNKKKTAYVRSDRGQLESLAL